MDGVFFFSPPTTTLDGVNARLPLLRKWEKTMEMGDIVFEPRIPQQKKKKRQSVSASKVKWRLPNANVPLDSSRRRRWRRHDFEYRVVYFVLDVSSNRVYTYDDTASQYIFSSSSNLQVQKEKFLLYRMRGNLFLLREILSRNDLSFPSYLLSFGPSASHDFPVTHCFLLR